MAVDESMKFELRIEKPDSGCCFLHDKEDGGNRDTRRLWAVISISREEGCLVDVMPFAHLHFGCWLEVFVVTGPCNGLTVKAERRGLSLKVKESVVASDVGKSEVVLWLLKGKGENRIPNVGG